MKTYVGINGQAKEAIGAYVGYNNKAVELPIFSPQIDDKIYGVSWDGSANTYFTRTDDAAGWLAPVPQHSDGNGGWTVGSSPCDAIMPWAGMIKSTDADAGSVVSIPKFYYKMEYASGTTGLKIQISNYQHPGFLCSPAHMDRGDGSGERDVVYVGRYHCASDYTSKSGVQPANNKSRPTFRNGISALGSKVWQWDYATLMTVRMLYLIEFADWDSQGKIGGGCTATNNSLYNMGATDSMTYHTGAVTSSIGATVYGANQYRYIEDLWGNCQDWVDGIYFNSANVYSILNPANFSDSTGGILTGTRVTIGGYLAAYSIPTVSGYSWHINPSSAGSGSATTYICDSSSYNGGGNALRTGGGYSQSQGSGLFTHEGYDPASTTSVRIGSRLMILP